MQHPLFERRRVYPSTTPARSGPSNFGKHETDNSTKAVGIIATGTFPFARQIVPPAKMAPSGGLDVTLGEDRHPGQAWHQGRTGRATAASKSHYRSSESDLAHAHGVFPGGR